MTHTHTHTHTAISIEECLDAFIGRGFSPETIIDVGVATGTPHLYERFPRAYYVLVEPLSHWQNNIDAHLRRLKGEHLKCAAGDVAEHAVISVPRGARPGGANLVHDYRAEDVEIAEEIEIVRLDQAIAPAQLGHHTLLKTDCQGFDGRAIKGSEGLLPNVAMLIAETSFRLPRGQISVLEVSPMLYQLGFTLAAVSPMSVNRNGIGIQCDLVFVNKALFNPWAT